MSAGSKWRTRSRAGAQGGEQARRAAVVMVWEAGSQRWKTSPTGGARLSVVEREMRGGREVGPVGGPRKEKGYDPRRKKRAGPG